jgi:hypothetical protein
VNPDGDKRGLLVLTHHGCYSAFSDWYQIPAKQLAQMVHRPVIWFWGHEHKLTIYDRYHVPDGIEAYGRCIGHGGMPVERGDAPDIECPWLAWDNRRYRNGEKINVGFNGHANLSLNGPELHVEYVDLNCTLLLTEDWRVDLQSGQLHGPNLNRVLQTHLYMFAQSLRSRHRSRRNINSARLSSQRHSSALLHPRRDNAVYVGILAQDIAAQHLAKGQTVQEISKT